MSFERVALVSGLEVNLPDVKRGGGYTKGTGQGTECEGQDNKNF